MYIIITLEEQRPHVKLAVGNHDRADIDSRLLVLPLLYSLKFCVPNGSLVDAFNRRSLSPELRDVMLRNPSLRELNFEFEHNTQQRELKIPLVSSDRLPALQSLTFSGARVPYDFDPQHCQLLSQCMDWSHLRRLDLGTSCPEHFSDEIGSSLGNLRSLAMGIRIGE